MKLLIDDAHIEEIRQIYDQYPVDGVTTNPSILSKVNKSPKETLREIREFIGPDALLFVQTIPLDAEGIVRDGEAIVRELGATTIVKIPSTPEGFKAIRILKGKGITTCGTAIYTPLQGYLAAKAGASYLAPYVNRIDNMGFDGVKVVQQIQDMLDVHDMDCIVMAASFKNSQQVSELCQYGIQAVTAAPDVIRGFVKNAAIDAAVNDFTRDFSKVAGEGNSMADVLK